VRYLIYENISKPSGHGSTEQSEGESEAEDEPRFSRWENRRHFSKLDIEQIIL